MSRALRIGLHGALALAAASALALGFVWHRDRTRPWEEPSCAANRFVRLQAGQRMDSGGPETWMVPVNPRCPRCLATLRHLVAAWSRRTLRPHLVVLVVDTRRHPGAAALPAIPGLSVWWDRDQLWRRRWGHRLYGELIEFDSAGRYLRTFMARDALPRVSTTAPADSSAPGTKGEAPS